MSSRRDRCDLTHEISQTRETSSSERHGGKTRSSAGEPPEEAGKSRPDAEADKRKVHCEEVRRQHRVKKRMQHESFRKVRALWPTSRRWRTIRNSNKQTWNVWRWRPYFIFGLCPLMQQTSSGWALCSRHYSSQHALPFVPGPV